MGSLQERKGDVLQTWEISSEGGRPSSLGDPERGTVLRKEVGCPSDLGGFKLGATSFTTERGASFRFGMLQTVKPSFKREGPPSRFSGVSELSGEE